MNRLVIIFVLLLLCVTTFFIFNNKENVTQTNQATATITLENPKDSGKYFTVPAQPKRVILLNSSSLDLWLGAGGKDVVVASPNFSSPPPSLYERLGDNFVNLGKYGSISPETLLLQKPDLVVFNSSSGAEKQLEPILQKAGVPILIVNNQTLNDTYHELTLYGMLTGKPELAEKEIERIKSNIAAIEKKNIGKTKPKVVLIWGTTTSFSMLTPLSRQSEFLQLAGGINIIPQSIAQSRMVPVSLEFIAQENPDYMLFITMGNKEKIQEQIDKVLSEDSAWQTIKAVRQKNVYVLPPELFTANYGLSVDQSVEYLSNIIHP